MQHSSEKKILNTSTSFSNSLTKNKSQNNFLINKKNSILTPLMTENNNSNIIQRKIYSLSKTINLENLNDNYINRPIVNFKPKMELYDFKMEKLINPSKLKYVVPVTQPACHKMKRIVSFKNKNKNNFLNSYSNDNEFENYMKEMKQIKMKNFMTLKKRKKYS